MIKRELRLIITFHTTTDAMAMEHACKASGTEGRLIPLPQSISAGCGLAWSAAPENESVLRRLMICNNIHPQEILTCMV